LRKIEDFRWGKKPYRIIVENLRNGKAIVAWVVDWCQCRGQTNNEKLVDLAPAAFEALGVPLGHGVQRVRVTVIAAEGEQ
jgi:rare lipoprotein A (peptidoglycan hydrolase)